MKKLSLVLTLVFASFSVMAQSISKIEPLSWWVGMKHPLQLIIYGKDLAGAQVKISGSDGVSVKKVIDADSPNYLFVDVEIAQDAKPGTYNIEIVKGKKKLTYPYVLSARTSGAVDKQGFSSKDMIYLLMPDRFAQGEIEQPKEQIAGLVDRNVPSARHGGNIQGIIDNLDYIANLGATTIWSTPLTEDREEGMSYHGYAASDFYNIDPRYGSNQLYKQMVSQADKKGLKVIMDMVPNHCGIDHPWMQDLPYKDWINHGGKYFQTRYIQSTHMDSHASKKEAANCVDGWFVPSMPDLNLVNPQMLNYLSQMTIWWIEEMGLSGLRVDTYPYNDKNAVAEWTRRIREEFPKTSIVGECWVGYPSMAAYWEGDKKETRNRDNYNSYLTHVMDFPLQGEFTKAIRKNEVKDWSDGMMNVYNVLAQDFLYERPNELLIFLDNHDIDRFAHATNSDPKKQMLAITMLATMRGVPQLYYGTEQLFRGRTEDGDAGKRTDFPGGWKGDKRNLFTAEGRTNAEDSVYQHTKKMFNWRKNMDVIHNGELTQFFPNPPENLMVYGRHNDNELVFVVLNNNATPRKINWDMYQELFDGYSEGVDIVSDKKIKVGQELEIDPKTSLAIYFKK